MYTRLFLLKSLLCVIFLTLGCQTTPTIPTNIPLPPPTPVPSTAEGTEPSTNPTLDPRTLLGTQPPTPVPADADCPVTQPQRLKPPQDAAIPDEPQFGNFITNPDQSILVGDWWTGQTEPYLVADKNLKVGWFRPAGAKLEISGHPLHSDTPLLDAETPDGYPTRFTPSGLMFSTAGCWQITATAANSKLTFVVYVAPQPTTSFVPAADCPITQPQLIKPPQDAAVPDEPQVGKYITNDDQSILVGSYWVGDPEHQLVANKWYKVGWFRPAGAELTIGGDPLIIPDPEADTTFSTEIPDGYPTRFTPTGIMFSTHGCWQITAAAAGSELTFVVYVAP